MYSVLVTPLPNVAIRVASGTPLIVAAPTPVNLDGAPRESLKFFSHNYFVLHLVSLDGKQVAVITPGKEN